jgi:hypothetical protein
VAVRGHNGHIRSFAAFAADPHLQWTRELEICGPDIKDLLHSRAGIEQSEKQCVIASPVCGAPVRCIEHRVHLVYFQVLHESRAAALDWYS